MKATWITAILAGAAGAAFAQTPQAAPAPTQVPVAAPRAMDVPDTRDEVVAKVREHFAQMDANRDGFLTREEMGAMRGERRAKRMAVRGAAPDAAGGGAFERLDSNHDNMISREEFASRRATWAEHGGMRGHGMAMRGHGMMMRRADADNDGRVSLAEAQAAAVKHFDMVDLNHDGRITPEERQQIRQKWREKRAPKAG